MDIHVPKRLESVGFAQPEVQILVLLQAPSRLQSMLSTQESIPNLPITREGAINVQ